MSASNMFSMMLHRTIFVFTIITAAVNSGPNRSRELKPREYQIKEVSTEIGDKPDQSLHQEENKRFSKNYRGFPPFPLSTIVPSKVYSRNEITVKYPNIRRYLDNKLFSISTLAQYREYLFYNI